LADAVRIRSAIPGLGLAAWTLLSSAAAVADIAVFDGSAREPFGLYVGDKENWGIPVGDNVTETLGGYLKVTADAETGARGLEWNGKGEAQLYLASAEPVDLSAAVAADAALVMVLKVAHAPKKDVTLRMGCGYPCAANADISKLLRALPADEWLRVSVDLKCFADGGLDASRVDTPLLLLTRRKLALSLAEVSIVDGAGPSAIINCR
jgi:beta-glucosidase